MGKNLRIGWIGAFGEARSHYLPCLSDWEDVELVALCHPDEDRLAAVAGALNIRKAFTQPGVMLRQVEMDAVFVTVPAAKCLPILEACVQRRLHVCTTPASLPSYDALRALERTVADAGVHFDVLFPRRHMPLLTELHGDLTAEEALTLAVVTQHAPTAGLAPGENILLDRVEWLQGVDLLRKLGGEVLSLTGLVGRYVDREHPTSLTAMLQFAEGGTGVLMADRAAGTRSDVIELHGRRRTAVIELTGEGRLWTEGVPEPRRYRQPETDDGPAPPRITGGYDTAARKFVDAILHGHSTETELPETLRTIELLLRIEGVSTDRAARPDPTVAE